ncbi:uncharacterized protein LOC115225177 [Argonauta hians]
MDCTSLCLLVLIGILFHNLSESKITISSTPGLENCLKTDHETFSDLELMSLCQKYYINRKISKAQSEEESIGLWNTIRGRDYINTLIDRFTSAAQNATTKRVRKEYRMLTDEERDNYHRAIWMMRQDTTVLPNKFEIVADLHFGPVTNSAHGGPGFLPWHRIYMLIWEEGLREQIPSVVVPYWDVGRDGALEDPRQSIIWSPIFHGNSDGLVTDGAFADFPTAYGPLLRHFGVYTHLPVFSDITRVFTQNTLGQISALSADHIRYIFELYHNNIHDWIGGTVSIQAWASFDPAFLLIHGYVDYIWHRFQDKQLRDGINIVTDYPGVSFQLEGTGFAADEPIGLIEGMTNAESVEEAILYRDLVDYEDAQLECDDQNPCANEFYQCVNNTCISMTRNADLCNTYVPIQNNFCVNKVCDIEQFSYFAVEVIHERLENECDMGNFPVREQVADKTMDIYRESATIIHQDKYTSRPADMCGRPAGCCKPVERINIQTMGDDGDLWLYRESAYVDTRFAVSRSQVFVVMRRTPESRFFVSSADEYGNLCENYVIDETGNKIRLENDQSVLITQDDPRIRTTLTEAQRNIYEYDSSIDGPPTVRQDRFVFLIYCRAHRNQISSGSE